MANKTVKCIISKDLVPTKPDLLTSECLRVETPSRIVLKPGELTKINLTVCNSSTNGRIAHIKASYDSRVVNIHIPDPAFYVAPGGQTTTYALIMPQAPSGDAVITFDAT